MSYKRQLPVPEHETIERSYWVSRDSLDGALSARCTLWNVKPLRVKCGSRVVWCASDGRLGDYRTDEIMFWFRTFPETDRELLRVETRPNAKELEDAKKAAGIK